MERETTWQSLVPLLIIYKSKKQDQSLRGVLRGEMTWQSLNFNYSGFRGDKKMERETTWQSLISKYSGFSKDKKMERETGVEPATVSLEG